jgi:hypothetical protein
VIGVTLIAAAVRFFRLDHQSYWLDEACTLTLIKRDFVHMLSTIPQTERTPPLYFIVAWLWSRLFGFGEFAVRSLSAVAGIAAVPVAYAAARRLFGARNAVFAAILIAVNPFLLYFSQEARSYSLLVLLSTCALWAFAKAWQTGGKQALALWALFGALALLTHYFAAFMLIPESVLLLWKWRTRRVALACSGWIATGLALLPLIVHQRNQGGFDFITAIPLTTRIVGIPHDFLVGSHTLPVRGLPLAATAIMVIGTALAIVSRRNSERQAARALLFLGIGAIVIPTVVALGGADYLLSRNELPAMVPLALVCAAGFGMLRRPFAGMSLLAIAVVFAVVADGYYAFDSSLQRDDWRSVAAHLGPPGTAVVVSPGYDTMPLSLYVKSLQSASSGRVTSEVDIVGQGRPPAFARPLGPVGFALVGAIRTASYEMLRYRSASPRSIVPADLQRNGFANSTPTIVIRGS